MNAENYLDLFVHSVTINLSVKLICKFMFFENIMQNYSKTFF